MKDPVRELIKTIHNYTVLKDMNPPVVSSRCMIYDVKEPEELRQKIMAIINQTENGIYLHLKEN